MENEIQIEADGINGKHTPTKLEWLWVVLNAVAGYSSEGVSVSFMPSPERLEIQCIITSNAIVEEIDIIKKGCQSFFDDICEIYGWSDLVNLKIIVK